MNIAFYDAKEYDMAAFDEVNKIFNYNMRYIDSNLDPVTAVRSEGCDAVCAFVNDKITAETITELIENGVKLIALRSAGYNNVDLESAYGRMHVVRVPAYSPEAVAEHAVALMLALNRKIHRSYFRTRDNNFSIKGLLGFNMHGKMAGIIGTGKIGRAVINILQGFGMNIIAYDPYPDKEYAEEKGIEYVKLENLFTRSDIISLHCPLNNSTVHIIDRDSIMKMKDNAMIINTGRGKLIDTNGLIEGLKLRKIGYAGLDVYEEESEYFFEDFSDSVVEDDVLERLLTFNNVLVTSHQGFFTAEALHNIAETTLQNIRDYFENDKLPNEICYKCGEEHPCTKEKEGRCF